MQSPQETTQSTRNTSPHPIETEPLKPHFAPPQPSPQATEDLHESIESLRQDHGTRKQVDPDKEQKNPGELPPPSVLPGLRFDAIHSVDRFQPPTPWANIPIPPPPILPPDRTWSSTTVPTSIPHQPTFDPSFIYRAKLPLSGDGGLPTGLGEAEFSDSSPNALSPPHLPGGIGQVAGNLSTPLPTPQSQFGLNGPTTGVPQTPLGQPPTAPLSTTSLASSALTSSSLTRSALTGPSLSSQGLPSAPPIPPGLQLPAPPTAISGMGSAAPGSTTFGNSPSFGTLGSLDNAPSFVSPPQLPLLPMPVLPGISAGGLNTLSNVNKMPFANGLPKSPQPEYVVPSGIQPDALKIMGFTPAPPPVKPSPNWPSRETLPSPF